MALDHTKKLRLGDLLGARKDELGSYEKLAWDITTESGVAIDRRKLSNLVAGEDVSLRISELRALDVYFAPRGEGLSAKPIFEQSAILAEIARSHQASFILGSFPRQEYGRIDLSQWDVRSMIEVLRGLNHYGQIQVDIEEVIYREGDRSPLRVAERESWYQQLTNNRASPVCFGSPRVNRATEIMLAEMIGVAPFKQTTEAERPAPFGFIWPSDRKRFVSSFELDGASVARLDRELADRIASGDTNVMGLCVDGRLLPVVRGGRRWMSYGIIAAQRRYNGRIWLALAGLTGAATYGVASEVWAVVDDIPPAETGRNSAVLWAVVEISVETDRSLLGDRRVVTAHRIMGSPQIWSPEP